MNTRVLAVLLVLLLIGCSDDEENESVFEIYIGSMFFDIDPGVIGRSFTDTVKLTIDGDSYHFETLVHTVTNWAQLCDVRGKVSDFGGASAVFTPTEMLGEGCSVKYTFQGTFPCTFAGDSLFMIKTDTLPSDTAVYEFRLGRQPIQSSVGSYLPACW